MTMYQFDLCPLTPIHVGTGETLEPFEYVILGDTLHRFSLDGLMLALPREAQARFVEVVERSVPDTREFVGEHAATAARVARWTTDVSSAASGLYSEQMAGGQAHPEIMTCIRTGDRAYVPGSSLKGALRTALLYHAMGEDDSRERNARRLEQRVFRFRRIQEDPFQAFKVGDGEPLADRTHVQRVDVRVRRDWGWSEKLSLLVETVPGVLSDNQEAVSEHAITFDQDFFRYHERAYTLNAEGVLAACRAFYGTHLETEQRAIGDLPEAAAAYEALAERAEALPDHACLVRLAWGSGRDATTVAYKLRGKRPTRSRRLTAGGFPLGWAELAVFDAEGKPFSVETTEEIRPVEPGEKPDTRPTRISDLQVGMKVRGVVRNIVNYGAFVDVGVGKDGLLYISEMRDGWVENVNEVVRRGQEIEVWVIKLDLDRQRIGLSLIGPRGGS